MSRNTVRSVAFTNVNDFVFGHAPHPLTTASGLTLGGGLVLPEVNFTLPPMMVTEETFEGAREGYREAIDAIYQRAVELSVPGFVLELEVLPPMTYNPEWGIEIARTAVEVLGQRASRDGLATAVRITPVDIREGRDVEHLWRGSHWDRVLETFEGAAQAGAEFLAIESVGGKEVHDEAVMQGDLAKSIFALSVLATKDMERLWTAIAAIAERTGTVAAGDAACGFANTAMVLAERHYIPKVFAATVRVVAAVRSLVAVECGARGPHKDCGYEGVYVKAMTGIPISSEGRSAAGAHLSPIGNIAGCVTDLWSNESIQNIKLLSGPAPTAAIEQLAYDCRLFNTASQQGADAALFLRDLHADSDSRLDPQAYVLRPDVVLDIATELVKVEGDYERGKMAARLALETMRNAHQAGDLALDDREETWLENLSYSADELPDTVEQIIAEMVDASETFKADKYEM